MSNSNQRKKVKPTIREIIAQRSLQNRGATSQVEQITRGQSVQGAKPSVVNQPRRSSGGGGGSRGGGSPVANNQPMATPSLSPPTPPATPSPQPTVQVTAQDLIKRQSQQQRGQSGFISGFQSGYNKEQGFLDRIETRESFINKQTAENIRNRFNSKTQEQLIAESGTEGTGVTGQSTQTGYRFYYSPTEEQIKAAREEADIAFRNKPVSEKLKLGGASLGVGALKTGADVAKLITSSAFAYTSVFETYKEAKELPTEKLFRKSSFYRSIERKEGGGITTGGQIATGSLFTGSIIKNINNAFKKGGGGVNELLYGASSFKIRDATSLGKEVYVVNANTLRKGQLQTSTFKGKGTINPDATVEGVQIGGGKEAIGVTNIKEPFINIRRGRIEEGVAESTSVTRSGKGTRSENYRTYTVDTPTGERVFIQTNKNTIVGTDTTTTTRYIYRGGKIEQKRAFTSDIGVSGRQNTLGIKTGEFKQTFYKEATSAGRNKYKKIFSNKLIKIFSTKRNPFNKADVIVFGKETTLKGKFRINEGKPIEPDKPTGYTVFGKGTQKTSLKQTFAKPSIANQIQASKQAAIPKVTTANTFKPVSVSLSSKQEIKEGNVVRTATIKTRERTKTPEDTRFNFPVTPLVFAPVDVKIKEKERFSFGGGQWRPQPQITPQEEITKTPQVFKRPTPERTPVFERGSYKNPFTFTPPPFIFGSPVKLGKEFTKKEYNPFKNKRKNLYFPDYAAVVLKIRKKLPKRAASKVYTGIRPKPIPIFK